MKKFFRFTCVHNADGLAAFVLVSIYLFIAWQLIMSGSLLAQIVVVLAAVYFVITSIIGMVIILADLIRRILAKYKKTAPTEVSAE